jgi:hypothetical protein
VRRVLLCASLALLLGHSLRAQEAAPATDSVYKKSVGFGVTINPVLLLIDESIGFFPLGISNFLIPIRISPRVIIEPEFGMFRTSSEEGGGESSFNNTRIGVGVLLGFPERGGLHPYIGPRFGWSRTSSESSFGGGGTFTTKMSGWNFGGVLGAHHFFSPHFSLGGEIQLMRSSSSIDDDSGGPVATEQSQSAVTTGGTAILRWFFK